MKKGEDDRTHNELFFRLNEIYLFEKIGAQLHREALALADGVKQKEMSEDSEDCETCGQIFCLSLNAKEKFLVLDMQKSNENTLIQAS